MERKEFIGKLAAVAMVTPFLKACQKDSLASLSSCNTTPTEVEGPYPYPGGEITNPLQRSDIKGGQAGVPLTLNFIVVNLSNQCALLPNARVDIWHCNKDGYYSGYDGQTGGANGTQGFSGETWLRGYQTSDAYGQLKFTTIYPGWEAGRATHIHATVFLNGTLRRQVQLAFNESTSEDVHASPLYAAHGLNPTSNSADTVFGNNAGDLVAETLELTGTIADGYSGTFNLVITV